MVEQFPHFSVLLEEILAIFRPLKLVHFLDGTLGAGGHAEALLKEHPEIEHYIGIDQDPEALKIAEERLAPWKHKLLLKQANFSQFRDILQENRWPKPTGMLVDLGVSSMQIDQAERGFSFMRDG